eukprot:6227257-Amphidinium_carterae.2
MASKNFCAPECKAGFVRGHQECSPTQSPMGLASARSQSHRLQGRERQTRVQEANSCRVCNCGAGTTH